MELGVCDSQNLLTVVLCNPVYAIHLTQLSAFKLENCENGKIRI